MIISVFFLCSIPICSCLPLVTTGHGLLSCVPLVISTHDLVSCVPLVIPTHGLVCAPVFLWLFLLMVLWGGVVLLAAPAEFSSRLLLRCCKPQMFQNKYDDCMGCLFFSRHSGTEIDATLRKYTRLYFRKILYFRFKSFRSSELVTGGGVSC